jgi:predicted ester cyclase
MRLLAVVLATFVFGLSTLLAVTPLSVATAQNATPAAGCPTTTEVENKATALRWNEEAVNGHNPDVLDEIATPDIIQHSGTLPDGVGLEHAKAVLGVLLTGFPDVKHTIEDVVTEDDLVVIRWTATGTQTGEFQGIAPTGKEVTWTGVNIYRLECGKIAEQWSELDGIGRLQQLGVLATPTP